MQERGETVLSAAEKYARDGGTVRERRQTQRETAAQHQSITASYHIIRAGAEQQHNRLLTTDRQRKREAAKWNERQNECEMRKNSRDETFLFCYV